MFFSPSFTASMIIKKSVGFQMKIPTKRINFQISFLIKLIRTYLWDLIDLFIEKKMKMFEYFFQLLDKEKKITSYIF